MGDRSAFISGLISVVLFLSTNPLFGVECPRYRFLSGTASVVPSSHFMAEYFARTHFSSEGRSKPRFVIAVGLPGSGKSRWGQFAAYSGWTVIDFGTIGRQILEKKREQKRRIRLPNKKGTKELADPKDPVHLAAIRGQIEARARIMMSEAILTGKPILMTSYNLTPRDRVRPLVRARKAGYFTDALSFESEDIGVHVKNIEDRVAEGGFDLVGVTNSEERERKVRVIQAKSKKHPLQEAPERFDTVPFNFEKKGGGKKFLENDYVNRVTHVSVEDLSVTTKPKSPEEQHPWEKYEDEHVQALVALKYGILEKNELYLDAEKHYATRPYRDYTPIKDILKRYFVARSRHPDSEKERFDAALIHAITVIEGEVNSGIEGFSWRKDSDKFLTSWWSKPGAVRILPTLTIKRSGKLPFYTLEKNGETFVFRRVENRTEERDADRVENPLEQRETISRARHYMIAWKLARFLGREELAVETSAARVIAASDSEPWLAEEGRIEGVIQPLLAGFTPRGMPATKNIDVKAMDEFQFLVGNQGVGPKGMIEIDGIRRVIKYSGMDLSTFAPSGGSGLGTRLDTTTKTDLISAYKGPASLRKLMGGILTEAEMQMMIVRFEFYRHWKETPSTVK